MSSLPCSRRPSPPSTSRRATTGARPPPAGGSGGASRAIVEAFDERIEYASTGHVDSKTELQEALARTGRAVQYEVLDVDGPPPERRSPGAAPVPGGRPRPAA